MDSKYLAEIKARDQAATPGPWKMENKPKGSGFFGTIHGKAGVSFSGNRADNEFIANARTDIPALVEEVERLHGIESELAYEKRANETIPVINKIVNDSAKKIKEQKNRIATLEIERDAAIALHKDCSAELIRVRKALELMHMDFSDYCSSAEEPEAYIKLASAEIIQQAQEQGEK